MLFFASATHLLASVGSTMNLGIYVVDSDMPQECKQFLKDRISSILSDNDINSALSSNRFFIVAKPTVVSKRTTAGNPIMISEKISISFRIGDAVDNRIFTSFNIDCHGVGQSELKAWMNALSQLKNGPNFVSQFRKAKTDISAYYDSQSDNLIDLALSQAKTNDYDAALATLAVIPTSVSNYLNVRNALIKIYQEKCNYSNNQLILAAKNVWTSSPNSDGGTEACRYLGAIKNPSKIQAEQIDTLYNQISKRLEILDSREYELLKQQIKNAHELELHQSENETELWSIAIKLGSEILCRQNKPINILTSFFNW